MLLFPEPWDAAFIQGALTGIQPTGTIQTVLGHFIHRTGDRGPTVMEVFVSSTVRNRRRLQGILNRIGWRVAVLAAGPRSMDDTSDNSDGPSEPDDDEPEEDLDLEGDKKMPSEPKKHGGGGKKGGGGGGKSSVAAAGS